MEKERFKIIPAVYLILKKEGKVLLLRRFNTGFGDGKYGLISGHVEEGESFRQTMVREAREEAGIEIRIDDLKIIHIMQHVSIARIGIFLTTEKWSGEACNMEPEKCDDFGWFFQDVLPENILPYIKVAIENAERNIFYSENF